MFLIPSSWYTVKKTEKKGRGVFATRAIEAGTVIGDYLGTLIKPDSADEKKHGLYDMAGGKKYDILADPAIEGIHFVNHSCANNCDIYPYQGHMLLFALRKIFKGEELSLGYWMYAPYDTETTCDMHACYCGSELCTGTMHHAAMNFDLWEKLVKKEFGQWYHKIPGKYGDRLLPLPAYPASIRDDKKKIYDYNLFGAATKFPEKYKDATLPTMTELRKRIRKTGRRLSFPSLKITVYGIRDGILLAKRAHEHIRLSQTSPRRRATLSKVQC